MTDDNELKNEENKGKFRTVKFFPFKLTSDEVQKVFDEIERIEGKEYGP